MDGGEKVEDRGIPGSSGTTPGWVDRLSVSDESGAVSRLVELVRSAPLMLLANYGPAVVCLLSAAFFGLWFLGEFVLQLCRWRSLGDPLVPDNEHGSLAICCFVTSLPVYWLSTAFYRAIRPLGRRFGQRALPPLSPVPASPRPGPLRIPRPELATLTETAERPAAGGADADAGQPSFRFRRIGLVLSGGGAKGVYQAGAMRAIHDFLALNGGLDSVVSIAGTSIGSWNALFWLGGLVGPGTEGGTGLQQDWWCNYRLSHLVRPASFPVVPGVASYLMVNRPWQEEFERLFGGPRAPGHEGLARHLNEAPPRHFYFSRSNVMSGRLAFDTNNREAADRSGSKTHDMDEGRRSTTTDNLREAVFASMAIPPLFPYSRIGARSDWCEDGGVVDNLPIRLATAFDTCDLLFVLPLNSHFDENERPRQLIRRLSRVIDVRQGVLERSGLKLIYLFNKQSAMTIRGAFPQTLEQDSSEPAPIPAFILTPGQPMRVRTTELWRSSQLRQDVFEQTRAATAEALGAFFELEALKKFFVEFDSVRKGNRIGQDGWTCMRVIDPTWVPGNTLAPFYRF